MHEVSLIENVIALVEQERAKQAFARVFTIKLKLGALGHAEPEALRFCFEAVTSGTIAEGSTLEIEMVPGEGWCPDCRNTVAIAQRFDACPACQGDHVKMTAGDDLRMVQMEVA